MIRWRQQQTASSFICKWGLGISLTIRVIATYHDRLYAWRLSVKVYWLSRTNSRIQVWLQFPVIWQYPIGLWIFIRSRVMYKKQLHICHVTLEDLRVLVYMCVHFMLTFNYPTKMNTVYLHTPSLFSIGCNFFNISFILCHWDTE